MQSTTPVKQRRNPSTVKHAPSRSVSNPSPLVEEMISLNVNHSEVFKSRPKVGVDRDSSPITIKNENIFTGQKIGTQSSRSRYEISPTRSYSPEKYDEDILSDKFSIRKLAWDDRDNQRDMSMSTASKSPNRDYQIERTTQQNSTVDYNDHNGLHYHSAMNERIRQIASHDGPAAKHTSDRRGEVNYQEFVDK
jgi:hypothetical protein